jgi:hypothetical protein
MYKFNASALQGEQNLPEWVQMLRQRWRKTDRRKERKVFPLVFLPWLFIGILQHQKSEHQTTPSAKSIFPYLLASLMSIPNTIPEKESFLSNSFTIRPSNP